MESQAPNAPRTVIAGGSGFLGTALAKHLAAVGHDVVVLARHPPARRGPFTFAAWDARNPGPWADHLDGAAAIVNLAGRSVDCVKTPDHRDEILRSRVESTLALGQAVARLDRPPPVWVQMSTAHIYGDPPEAIIDERSAFGEGLAPTVGRAWEDAFERSILPTQRGVILRTSFVLGRAGGALRRLAFLARCGLGGRVGSGRQGISWIHERDMNRIFERAISSPTMRGVYIASAPAPVSNAEFMRALREALRMPIGLPAPGPLVRIAAPLLLRTDPELALYGRFCVPRRLLDEGFGFDFPTVAPALADLLGRRSEPDVEPRPGDHGGIDATQG